MREHNFVVAAFGVVASAYLPAATCGDFAAGEVRTHTRVATVIFPIALDGKLYCKQNSPTDYELHNDNITRIPQKTVKVKYANRCWHIANPCVL